MEVPRDVGPEAGPLTPGRDLGPSWSDKYQHQEYLKCVYHPTRAPDGRVVKNSDEHKALGKGWYATPGDFPQRRSTVSHTVSELAGKKEVVSRIRPSSDTPRSRAASNSPPMLATSLRAPAIAAPKSTNTESAHQTTPSVTTMQPQDRRERAPRDAVKRFRSEGDSWDERIQDWAQNQDTISVAEVLASCLHKPHAQWTQADKNRIARALQALGWKQFQRRRGKFREWRHRRTQ